MTYGYEDPVVMPTMQVYDTDLAKMYIAGVKDQYDKAKEEVKDFMKLYQDFYSPILGATQAYHDMTTGGALRLINQLYANGDPFKNPESRAIIQNFINSVDIGKLKALEQQRDNYKTYLDNVARLDAAGKLNKDAENYFLSKDNLLDFTALDDNGNVRQWNRLSPNEYQSLHDLTRTEYEKFKPTEYIGAGSRPGYDLYGVSKENRKAAEDASIGILQANNGGWGEYYFDLAKRRAAADAQSRGIPLTMDAIDREMRLMINNENPIQTIEQLNPLYEKNYEHRLKMAEDAAHQARAHSYWLALQNYKADAPDKKQDAFNVGYTTQVAHDSNAKASKWQTSYANRIKDAVKHYLTLSKLDAPVTFGGIYHSKEGSAKVAKLFEDFSKISDKTTDAEYENIMKRMLDMKFIDENGIPTQRLERALNVNDYMSNPTHRFVKQSKNGKESYLLTKNAAANSRYNRYTLLNPGGDEGEFLARHFTASKTREKTSNIGLSGENYRFAFNTGGWKLSQVRLSNFEGYTGNVYLKRLLSFLKNNNIEGGVISSADVTSHGMFPNARGTNDWDISGRVLVRYSDIDRFLTTLGIGEDDVQGRANMLRTLGLGMVVKNGTELKEIPVYKPGSSVNDAKTHPDSNISYSKTIKNNSKNAYVVLPVTRTIDRNGYNFSRIDTAYDKMMYGASKAETNAQDRQMNALIEDGEIQ